MRAEAILDRALYAIGFLQQHGAQAYRIDLNAEDYQAVLDESKRCSALLFKTSAGETLAGPPYSRSASAHIFSQIAGRKDDGSIIYAPIMGDPSQMANGVEYRG